MWYGFVDCVFVEGMDPDGDGFGGLARLSGTASDGEDFWVEVKDPGSGPAGDGNDPIRLEKPEESGDDCNDENDEADDHELGRGEAVVHNPEG